MGAGGLRTLLSPRAIRWAGILLSALSLVALVALLGRMDWREVIQPLGGAKVGWLLGAVAVALAVEVAKTARWQLLLGVRATTLPALLGVVFTARILNALVPLRAGDVWRVASATRGEGRPFLAAGGSVVVEKLLDGAALGGASMVLLWSVGLSSLLALGACVGLVAAVALAPVVGRHLRARQRVRRWLAALAYLRDWRVLTGAVALTLVALGFSLLVNLLVLYALGLPVTLTAGLVMLLAGYAVGLVPSGPAQIGVFELAVAAPLAAVGLAMPNAVTAALGLHLVLLAMLALGGLLALPLGLQSRTVRPSAGDRSLVKSGRVE